jgi:ankyrin repeat protein
MTLPCLANFYCSSRLRAYKVKIKSWGWRTHKSSQTGPEIETVRRRRRKIAAGETTNLSTLSPALAQIVPRQDSLIATDQILLSSGVRSQNALIGRELHDLNRRDSSGKTRLHRATEHGDVVEVNDLLSRGAFLNIQDTRGNQPLHLATIGNYPNIIRILLDSGASANTRGADGRTPVHLALHSPEALGTLLSARPHLSIPDNDGNTALHEALSRYPKVEHTSGGTVEQLLLHGARANTPNLAGVTPFHMAIRQVAPGYESYLPIFLQHDADVFTTTKDGESPFQAFLNQVWNFACWESHRYTETMLFLHIGADPNTIVKQEEKLLYAILNLRPLDDLVSSLDFHELLMTLCRTADIRTPSGKGDLPLHEVVRNCHWNRKYCVEVMKVLLQRGADPNQLNGKAERPIHILFAQDISFEDIKKVLQCLLENDVDPMLVDSSGELPVYTAYRRWVNGKRRDDEGKEIVKMLVDSYIARPESFLTPSGHNQVLLWWRVYRLFRLTKHWSEEASELLNTAASTIPEAIAENLSKLLLIFAAEDLLAAAKEFLLFIKGIVGLSDGEAQYESRRIVCILRDCRKLGLEVNPSWYHFLLELFD